MGRTPLQYVDVPRAMCPAGCWSRRGDCFLRELDEFDLPAEIRKSGSRSLVALCDRATSVPNGRRRARAVVIGQAGWSSPGETAGILTDLDIRRTASCGIWIQAADGRIDCFIILIIIRFSGSPRKHVSQEKAGPRKRGSPLFFFRPPRIYVITPELDFIDIRVRREYDARRIWDCYAAGLALVGLLTSSVSSPVRGFTNHQAISCCQVLFVSSQA